MNTFVKKWGLSVKRLADAEILVVDWAYYSNQNNQYRKNVAPSYSSGCQAYKVGTIPKLSNERKAKGFKIRNPQTINLCFLDFPDIVFGAGIPQCDQVIYPSPQSQTKPWLELLELKYSAPPYQDFKQGSRWAINLQEKYDEAVAQIESTFARIEDAEGESSPYCQNCKGIVCFPRLDILKGQRQSNRVGSKRKRNSKLRLPDILSSDQV
jgi:hypothetical protein